MPWLGPDINDCLTGLASDGVPGVVVVPIGFVSDHMEVIFDLDVEAARTASDLGLPMARAATPGTDPGFVAMITSLVRDAAAGARGDATAGAAPRAPGPDACSRCGAGCCRAAS